MPYIIRENDCGHILEGGKGEGRRSGGKEEKEGDKTGNEENGKKVGDLYKAVAIEVKIRLKILTNFFGNGLYRKKIEKLSGTRNRDNFVTVLIFIHSVTLFPRNMGHFTLRF